jgi:hypothetical protein
MPKGGCSDETSGVAESECVETVVGGLARFGSRASANIKMSSRHSRISEVFTVIVPPPNQLPQGFCHSSSGPVTPTRFFAVVLGGAGDAPLHCVLKEAPESCLQGLKVNAKWVRRRISNGNPGAGQ